MRPRYTAILAASLLGAAVTASGALAAGGPPPPTATNGHKVTQVAAGLATPTSFAFGDHATFEGDGGNLDNGGTTPGGVFLLSHGTGTRLAGSPIFVSGMAWHNKALYIAGGNFTASGAQFSIQKWSGFNGTTFAHRRAIYTAPKKFDGFNGVAFGPDGRLYVGVDLGLTDNNDHGPAKTPYVYDILSMTAGGKGLKVFATGMRQPWQMAFAPGSSAPLVSDLGQDSGAKNPPDFILKVHRGDNFGFPHCNHTVAKACKGYAKPFKRFSPHSDIMGLAIIGHTLYMTSFLGTTGKAGEVFKMPLSGGAVKPVVTGFVAPVVGLGQHAGRLYIGELTGQVFSVKP